MERIQSNRFKCRNLPADYEVLDQMTTKPTATLVTSSLCGAILLTKEDYLFLGSLVLFMSVYGLIFSRSTVLIEFCKDFVIFYLDERREECYVIYWNEIVHYDYKSSLFNTDYVRIILSDGSEHTFKSLAKHQVIRNFDQHVHLLENDD